MDRHSIIDFAGFLSAHGANNPRMLAADIENVIGARIHASGRPAAFGPMDEVLWADMTPFTCCQRQLTVFRERPLCDLAGSRHQVRSRLNDMLVYRIQRRVHTDDASMYSMLFSSDIEQMCG